MSALGGAVLAAGAPGGAARELLAALARNAAYAAVLYAGVRLVLGVLARLGPPRPRPQSAAAGAAAKAGRARAEVPPAAELVLWAAVALRLVLPPALAAPWSVRTLAASILGAGAAGAGSGLRPDGLFGALLGAGGPAPGGASVGTGAAGPGLAVLLGALAVVWGLGAAIFLGRAFRARRRFRARIAAGRRLTSSGRAAARRLALAAERWRGELGIRRPIALVAGPGAGSPYTLGLLRPVVWLPERLLREGDPGPSEAALAHELVHVRDLDDLWLRLLALVRAVYFFHPVAWWTSARIADARERAVDDAVLDRRLVAPRAYGRALLATLAGPGSGEPFDNPADRTLLPAFGTPHRSTPMRIHRIARRHADPRDRRPRRAATRTVLVLAALVALAALPMAAAQPAPAPPVGHAAGHSHEHAPGAWVSPLHHAHLSSPFGERHDPLAAGHPSRHHDGVDLGAPSGTPVLAPAAGVVTVATEHYGPAPGWGTVVVVDHGDGLETLYAHLGTLGVTAGQKVARGEALGTVGATGQVTGPHLHFEVRRDGKPVDPATVVPGLPE